MKVNFPPRKPHPIFGDYSPFYGVQYDFKIDIYGIPDSRLGDVMAGLGKFEMEYYKSTGLSVLCLSHDMSRTHTKRRI